MIGATVGFSLNVMTSAGLIGEIFKFDNTVTERCYSNQNDQIKQKCLQLLYFVAIETYSLMGKLKSNV